MKIGDLVREITRMNRVPDLGLVLEVDAGTVEGNAMYLIDFYGEEPCWMAKHHLELIGES